MRVCLPSICHSCVQMKGALVNQTRVSKTEVENYSFKMQILCVHDGYKRTAAAATEDVKNGIVRLYF